MNDHRVREYWRRVWTEGDTDYALEFYAPAFRQNGRELTAERFAAGAAAFRAHFADFTAEVDRLFRCGDDVVVTRVVIRARHVGDFPGVPATGAPIEVTGLDVFCFAGGSVVEHLHEADHEAMWEQLGVPLPPG